MRSHIDYPREWSYKRGCSYTREGLVLQIIR